MRAKVASEALNATSQRFRGQVSKVVMQFGMIPTSLGDSEIPQGV
jgi:hypothetical protein